MNKYKSKRKGQRKQIIYLGICNVQRLKNKHKIIIKNWKN